MSILKIALLQITPCKNLDENLEKGITCCKKAKEKGADIALFPEMWSNGYNIHGRPVDEWKQEATCNYPKTVPDCNGNSSVFDGVVYLPNESGSRDTCIFQAGENEGIYISDLDLEQLRSYRESEVHGNAYRHPKKYNLLIESKIDKPFIRSDYRE